MEPPVNLNTKSIRDEKVKVLMALEKVTPDYVQRNMVRGQYGEGTLNNKKLPAYREEERVSPESNVETFAAMKLYIQNYRWSGVPFYIRTGKRMQEKSTEIIIQFKTINNVLYFNEYENLQPNLLVIKVQPREGIYIQFNGKKPGVENTIIPLQMDFCQNCQFENNSPEAYERLFFEIMKGDSTLFTRWDEVEYSWKFVDTIAEVWRNEKPSFPNYESGTWGPEESDELLRRDGRFWWNV
jgi:glucose-6-phosphate 1-dehydrogenase